MGVGKKNHVNLDPTNYTLMTIGESKVGKTTLMMEVLTKLVGDNYMFVELGRERGGDALEGIRMINCPTWSDDYDEDTNSMGWDDFVDEIVDNKKSDPDYENLKVIVMDTYDQYIQMACGEVIRRADRENPDKKITTLNQIGFGSNDRVIDLMFSSIDKLNSVGITVWWIGHCKVKSVTDIVSGTTYDVLTSDQQQNYFNALKKNLHFLCLAYVSRDISIEKTGKKNLVTKKDETKSIVKNETRKISFRDNNYSIDCGGRFSHLPEEPINMDADEFIEVLKEAILFEQAKSGINLEDDRRIQSEYAAKREAKIAEAEKKHKAEKELAPLVAEITNWIKTNQKTPATLKPVVAKIKELTGDVQPSSLTKIEDAETVLELIRA